MTAYKCPRISKIHRLNENLNRSKFVYQFPHYTQIIKNVFFLKTSPMLSFPPILNFKNRMYSINFPIIEFLSLHSRFPFTKYSISGRPFHGVYFGLARKSVWVWANQNRSSCFILYLFVSMWYFVVIVVVIFNRIQYPCRHCCH